MIISSESAVMMAERDAMITGHGAQLTNSEAQGRLIITYTCDQS